MLIEKIEIAEFEMNKFEKVLFQICGHWSNLVDFKQKSTLMSKQKRSKNQKHLKPSIKHFYNRIIT